MRKRTLTRNVGVMFDDATYQKLVKMTDQKEVPISVFIRNLIESYIDLQEKRARFEEGMLELRRSECGKENHND